MAIKEPAVVIIVQFRHILLVIHFELLLVIDQTVLEAALLLQRPLMVS